MVSAIVVIGLLAMIALALGLLCILLFVIARALWHHAFDRRDAAAGGEAPDSAAAMPDPDGPAWWAEFERGFAAHVAKQRSNRFGRRAG